MDSKVVNAGTLVGAAPGVPVTRDLAAWAAGLRFSDLPDAVTHQFKRCLLDYYCAVIAGSTAVTSRAMQDYFGETDAGSASGVVGTLQRFAPHTAALINGAAAHGLEIDDGYTAGSYHPGAACLPAVMAVAEARGCSVHEVVTAGVVAYEVSCRLARAGHPTTWQNGFHNTGINGVFGCAAGVGSLLGLDAQHMTWALGMAGSFSSGLFEFLGEGSEVKRLHPGKCARDGVVVAELAKRGVDGPVTGIEGKNGYFNGYASGNARIDTIFDGLGHDYEMLKTYVKPYPCCRHLHAPIDAVLALKQLHHIDPAGVVGVQVQTNRVAANHNHQHYTAFLDAQMSIPYAVAASIIFDEVGLEAFGAHARAREDIARLVPLIHIEITEEMQAPYPKQRPARVIITLDDGRQLAYTQQQPYGEPDNPIDDAALNSKFHAICDPVIGREQAAAIIHACWALDLPAIYKLTALDKDQVRQAVS